MHILIADDHPLLLHGLSGLLAQRGHTVATVADIPEAIGLLTSEAGFDLLVLDFNLPTGPASLLLRNHAAILPPRIVVLSGILEPEDVLDVLDLGACVFLPKCIDTMAMIGILERLDGLAEVKGGYVWDVAHHRLVAAHDLYPKGTVLTTKEREVFMLMRKGLQDKQIADSLELSIHTVRVHLRAIKRKRGSRRRHEVME